MTASPPKNMMNLFGKFSAFLVCVAVFSIQGISQAQSGTGKKPLVLVELFTSINCLNCPPAERALTFLQEQQPYPEAELITLAYHVDYLNNENLKDEFSDQLFTQRQQIYGQKFLQGTIYTPQMVVDGNTQLMGSDLKKARAAVLENIKTEKAQLTAEFDGENLKVAVEKLAVRRPATLYLAVAENTVIPKLKRFGGANNTNQYNSVVRMLKPVSRILPTANSLRIQQRLELQPEWKKENTFAVLFIQDNTTRSVLAIEKIPFAADPINNAK